MYQHVGLSPPALGFVREPGRDQRVGQLGLCRHADPSAVPVRTAVARRSEHVVVQGVDHHAGHDLTVERGRDRHGEARVAVEIVGRAVDRVDDPLDARRARLGRAFLADDRVVGPSCVNGRDDVVLGGTVHLGHHVGPRRLGLDERSRTRQPVDEQRTRLCCRELCEIQQLARRGSGHGRHHAAPVASIDVSADAVATDGAVAAEGLVDLRSDTVTKPTAVMRRAMANAVVGDDGYGEDPTVRDLEETFAQRVGKAAAVYVPSGTMANQIALRLLGRPGTRVVAGRRQHVVVYEAGAAGLNSSTQFHLVADTDGLVHADDVRVALAEADHHQPPVSAVFVENTHMPAGGVPWPVDGLRELGALGVPVHLDGARLFNAEIATGVAAAEFAAPATTVMCCLSKGLAAPVGSLLAGSRELIAEARVERKRLGGAMRQAGVIAAAGLVGLQEMVGRLADDHRRAKRLADAVAEHWPYSGLDPDSVQTNVVVFRHGDPPALLHHLRGDGVLAGLISPGVVRLMTHVDVDDQGIERTLASIATAP